MGNIRLYTGCSGFYNRHWREIFYPEKLPQRLWFDFYSKQLPTLEINTTFYKFPTAERLAKWYEESDEGFVFTVKAPRLITHYKSFNDCDRLLDDFYVACYAGLKEKLGCILFQTPGRFSYTPERLALICASMRPGFRNVIEFRNLSWWHGDVIEALQRNNIIFCNVSYPKLPESMIVTSDVFYMRLHGDEKLFYSNYETDRLARWHHQILQLPGVAEAYIYFNNTAGVNGILNAMTFADLDELI